MKAAEVINVAKAEEGYVEKKSNAKLDDKTANAGSNNFTKYARDYLKWTGVNNQGQPWCGMFLLWIFVMAFGLAVAKTLLCGIATAYTPTFAQQFKNAGRWHKKDPKPGDVIFFKNATRICHVGLVERVANGKVYTIEGNTSNANAVVPNGGMVCRKSYSLNNTRIAGYGRPAYDSEQPAQCNPGTHVPLNYKVGTIYTVKTAGLNVRTKKASEDPSVIPGNQVIAVLKAGDKVKNQATTLVNGKIWMYLGLDAKRREKWACADSGSVAYIE